VGIVAKADVGTAHMATRTKNTFSNRLRNNNLIGMVIDAK